MQQLPPRQHPSERERRMSMYLRHQFGPLDGEQLAEDLEALLCTLPAPTPRITAEMAEAAAKVVYSNPLPSESCDCHIEWDDLSPGEKAARNNRLIDGLLAAFGRARLSDSDSDLEWGTGEK